VRRVALLLVPLLIVVAVAACAPFATSFRLASLARQAPAEALLMPVAGVRVTEVADTWGAPRSGGRRHEGQDIFAPRGTPVVSAVPGIVTSIGSSARGGNVVWVTGTGRRRYYYAHLEGVAPGLQIGDRIDEGVLLGFVGSSGNAADTPPHLHFGLYGSRGALDPLPLLRDP
jgi:murein DD-endopeptidase MepM/ murein hydrolase activator NlpD